MLTEVEYEPQAERHIMPVPLSDILLVPQEQYLRDRIRRGVPDNQVEFYTDSTGKERLLVPTGSDTTRLLQECNSVDELITAANGHRAP